MLRAMMGGKERLGVSLEAARLSELPWISPVTGCCCDPLLLPLLVWPRGQESLGFPTQGGSPASRALWIHHPQGALCPTCVHNLQAGRVEGRLGLGCPSVGAISPEAWETPASSPGPPSSSVEL